MVDNHIGQREQWKYHLRHQKEIVFIPIKYVTSVSGSFSSMCINIFLNIAMVKASKTPSDLLSEKLQTLFQKSCFEILSQ